MGLTYSRRANLPYLALGVPKPLPAASGELGQIATRSC